ncbi:MAG TPA: transcription antitermination factor NusB [Myxococcales bacterium]|nr:transcription antitermination factor NusB [Myxococcales bacterium]HAN30167.1 transcription antitermination factor NusB [Myxococcales bacterium]|tara:strand:- start:107 stop:556 length:450 start_codon:yes stop_codon:yes gene_type:complete
MGVRRRARESALQILYGIDWNTQRPLDACELFWDRFAGERPAAYDQIRATSDVLVEGVVTHRVAIDELLISHSHNWKLDRMSVVDRNILRIGTYELMFAEQPAPRKVVLNEAIEVAKKFGSQDSSGFVNGVLHQISLAKKAVEQAGGSR